RPASAPFAYTTLFRSDVPRPPGRARGGGGAGARRGVGAARAGGDGWARHGDVDGPNRRDDRRPGHRRADVISIHATRTPTTARIGETVAASVTAGRT